MVLGHFFVTHWTWSSSVAWGEEKKDDCLIPHITTPGDEGASFSVAKIFFPGSLNEIFPQVLLAPFRNMSISEPMPEAGR